MALFIAGFLAGLFLEVVLFKFWWKGDKSSEDSDVVVLSAEEAEHCEKERTSLRNSVLDKEREISHLHARVAMLEEETDRIARAQAAAQKVASATAAAVPTNTARVPGEQKADTQPPPAAKPAEQPEKAKKAVTAKPKPKPKAVKKSATASKPASKAEKKPAAKKAPAKKVAAKSAAAKPAGGASKASNLRQLAKIKGVGPKLAEIMAAEGFDTVEKVVAGSVDELKAVLRKAGSRYANLDPSTWAEQGKLILAGDNAALKKLHASLK